MRLVEGAVHPGWDKQRVALSHLSHSRIEFTQRTEPEKLPDACKRMALREAEGVGVALVHAVERAVHDVLSCSCLGCACGLLRSGEAGADSFHCGA